MAGPLAVLAQWSEIWAVIKQRPTGVSAADRGVRPTDAIVQLILGHLR